MISNNKFVRESLELNIFFLRIMKEHMMFISLSLTPRDSNFKLFAEKLKSKLEELLRKNIRISPGLICNEALTSGELVTNFTLNAEKKTEFYTGIHINTDITDEELRLIKRGNNKLGVTPNIVKAIEEINNCIIEVLKEVIEFKDKIKAYVNDCKMFTTNYPLMIDHILEEAEEYLKSIVKLQQKEEDNTLKELFNEEKFWNHIMEEHAKFIRGMLDPTEEKLIKIADNFVKQFEKLSSKENSLTEVKKQLEEFTRESVKLTQDIRNFKKQGTEGILNCNVKSIILPLLSDHVLREANHYLRLLSKIK